MTLDTLYRSLDLVPGEEEVVILQADTRISNASLGEILSDANGRTVVKVSYSKTDVSDSDEEEDAKEVDSIGTFVLCALTAGKVRQPRVMCEFHFQTISRQKVENAQVNLVLEAGVAYKFELIGKKSALLSLTSLQKMLTRE